MSTPRTTAAARREPRASPGTSPAALVVERFGRHGFTVPQVAEICDVDKSTVYYWLRDKQPRNAPRSGGAPSRGGGGIIPAKHHPALLDAAAAHGIRLTPREVVYGR